MTGLSFSLQAVSPLQVGVIFFASLTAAVWDLASRRIPNWLTFPMLATGLVWSAWMGGPMGFVGALAASALLAAPYVLLFLYAGGGGGDVKLMAAIGAWAGLVPGLVVLVLVALCGVVMGVVVALAKGQLRTTMNRVTAAAYSAVPTGGVLPSISKIIPMDKEKMQPMPYGLAIFAGVCLATVGVLIWRP